MIADANTMRRPERQTTMIRLNATKLFGLAIAVAAMGLVGCGQARTANTFDVNDEADLDRVVEMALAEHDALVAQADRAAAQPSLSLDGYTQEQKQRRENFILWSMQEQERAAEYVGLAQECDTYAALDPDAERKVGWLARAQACRTKALIYSERSRYFATLAEAQRRAVIDADIVRGYDADVAMKRLPVRQSPEQAVLPAPDDLASAE